MLGKSVVVQITSTDRERERERERERQRTTNQNVCECMYKCVHTMYVYAQLYAHTTICMYKCDWEQTNECISW